MKSTHYITHEEIRERAHQIWEKGGRPEGRDTDHWLQAEKELQNQRERPWHHVRSRGFFAALRMTIRRINRVLPACPTGFGSCPSAGAQGIQLLIDHGVDWRCRGWRRFQPPLG